MTYPTIFAQDFSCKPCSPTDINTIIAPRQKAVHDFHESHHPTLPVTDIYSPAWQSRLAAWYAWFTQSQPQHQHRSPSLVMVIRKNQQQHSHHHHIRPTSSLPAQICPSPEELDLRALFFTNPVLAFALWGVLQAFYALDMAVCKNNSSSSSYSHSYSYSSYVENTTSATAEEGEEEEEEEEETNATLNHYHALPPLSYLTSTSVRHTWQLSLETLNADIRSGRLVGSELEMRLWRVYEGVEGLEGRIRGLVEDFGGQGSFAEGGEGEGSGLGAILELVRNVMDERCLMIDEILGREDGAESDEMVDAELKGAQEEGAWVLVAA